MAGHEVGGLSRARIANAAHHRDARRDDVALRAPGLDYKRFALRTRCDVNRHVLNIFRLCGLP